MKWAQISTYYMDIDRYLDIHIYNKLVGITKCCGNLGVGECKLGLQRKA